MRLTVFLQGVDKAHMGFTGDRVFVTTVRLDSDGCRREQPTNDGVHRAGTVGCRRVRVYQLPRPTCQLLYHESTRQSRG